jgi:2-keto-4-pentenoate hydratase
LEQRSIDDLAHDILAAAKSGKPLAPPSGRLGAFGLGEAYAVSRRILALRTAAGERQVGWKIGFTNRTIWDEYGVHAPIWAPMYDRTVAEVAPAEPAFVALAGLCEPRIEPEICFQLSRVPEPDMDAVALAGCIGAVAHGFEIVQSVYPAWKFTAADTVAAFALHGAYRHGPFAEIGNGGDWLARLEDFSIRLFRDGQAVDHGHAHSVLGGPVHALGHMVRGLAETPFAPGLRAGDIVTTGTVTRAFPVRRGESWRSEIEGLPLPGLTLTFD